LRVHQSHPHNFIRQLRAGELRRAAGAQGQAADARSHADVALGYLSKPFTREDIVAALDATELMLRGEKPMVTVIPRALELFEGRREKQPVGKSASEET